ncbi:hypothetical protein MOQ_006257 [Trypanosoma cruzi marinkellei]|uniref:Leucine-rich repeat protein (LRRP) n=1 Tax=Trypanosoma cruzi marinkellei TaxID=85056 RepID=K2NM56_TRYCR|nr:hypothetical protein MOQ_006257 [Trypanosoma cruzi marinkellei]
MWVEKAGKEAGIRARVMYTSLLGLTSNEDEREDGTDGVVLLRNDVSEFTSAEIQALSSLELSEDPTPNAGHMPIDGCSLSNDGCNGSKRKRRVKTQVASSFLRGEHPKCCRSFKSLLLPEERVGGKDSMADAVLSTSQLHVEDRALRDTSIVECFLNLTHLYMQHNHITSLEGLSLLVQLTVLVVHHNEVESLRPLADLNALRFVDARFNSISKLDPLEDLPRESLRYLSLLSNPCCRSESTVAVERDAYRQSILQCCPLLEMLDDLPCQTSSSSDEDDSVVEGKEKEKEEEEEEEGVPDEGNTSSPLTSHDDAPEHRSHFRTRMSHMMKLHRTSCMHASLPSPAVGNLSGSNDATATARLCQQFEHRAGNIRRQAFDHASKLPCPDHSRWAGESVKKNGQDDDRDDEDESDELPLSLMQERETKSRLYADIHFALGTSDAQVQQLMGNVWEDVGKVLRTRQALVRHRRERMELQRQQPSGAYTESLALLQKEHRTTNLDKYRK